MRPSVETGTGQRLKLEAFDSSYKQPKGSNAEPGCATLLMMFSIHHVDQEPVAHVM